VLICSRPSGVRALAKRVVKNFCTLVGQAAAEPASLEAERVAILANPYGS